MFNYLIDNNNLSIGSKKQSELDEFEAYEKDRQEILDKLEDFSLYSKAEVYPLTYISHSQMLSDMRDIVEATFSNMDDETYESALQDAITLIDSD